MNARVEPDTAEIERVAGGEGTVKERNGARTIAAFGPRHAVVAAFIGAVIVYAALARAVESPRIFYDELLYLEAADSLVSGDGLSIRGESYGRGPLYPVLLAPLVWLSADREAAYELAKALNALLFALAAIPLYLLSRRLLSYQASLAVAFLSVAIPSAMYVSVVMTESVAYLTFALAVFAIFLALEQPTFARQCAALGAIVLAVTARPQFVSLYAAYLLGLVLVSVLVPRRQTRWVERLRELVPTALSLLLSVTVFFALPFLRGDSPERALGDYEDVWQSYDLVELVDWFVYQLANLELYVAVIPFAVSPIVLVSFFRCSREGSHRHAAFMALLLTVPVTTLLVAAAANASEFSLGRLHDRYAFYVVPLWLIVFFAWLQDGARSPRVAAAFGAGIALLLPLFIPFSEYAREDGAQRFAGVASTLWAALQTGLAGDAYGWGRAMLLTFVGMLLAAAFLLPRRLAGGISLLAIVLTFLVTGQFAWYLAIRDGTDWAFVDTPSGRQWVDERVAQGAEVTSLTVANACRLALVDGDSFHRTEFFNGSVAGAANIGRRETGLPSTRVHVSRSGALQLSAGKPFVADYVLTHDEVFVEGRRVAVGTISPLVLWDVDGPVRLKGIGTLGRFRRGACESP